MNVRAAVQCLANSKATQLLMEGRGPVMVKSSNPKLKSYPCFFFLFLMVAAPPIAIEAYSSTCDSQNTPSEQLV